MHAHESFVLVHDPSLADTNMQRSILRTYDKRGILGSSYFQIAWLLNRGVFR
jgi:hypothetical protein